MTRGFPKGFGALPRDEVTPERLELAIRTISELCDVTPASIPDKRTLARRLTGVSHAITNIVISRGKIHTTQLGVLDGEPIPYHSYRFERPLPQADAPDQVFVALPDSGHPHSAQMRVQRSGADDREEVLYSAIVPREALLDDLLDRDLANWDDLTTQADDVRSGRRETSFPFQRELQSPALARYFSILRELAIPLRNFLQD